MKNRIINGFIEEIKEKGIKFTMDDLAKRIGISKRTLYEHFSSKIELLEEIINQTFNEMDDKTEKIINDPNLPLLEKIKGVISVLPTHFEIYDLRILDQMKRYYPQQWEKVDASLKDDWETLRLLIEQGIQEGLIVHMDPSIIIKLIIDATNSVLDQRFYMKNNITVSQALSSIVDVLLFGLIPNHKR